MYSKHLDPSIVNSKKYIEKHANLNKNNMDLDDDSDDENENENDEILKLYNSKPLPQIIPIRISEKRIGIEDKKRENIKVKLLN